MRHILTNSVPIPYSITEVDNVVCFEQKQIEPIYFSNGCNFKPITLALQLYVEFLTYEWEDRTFTFNKQISILKVIINRVEQSLALLQELFFRLVRGTEFRPSSCQFLRPRVSQATEDRVRRMKVVHLEQVLPIDTLV